VLSSVLKLNARLLWHKDYDVKSLDLIVLPGGASYGDYLRPGAIAKRSPIMSEIMEFADKGGLVLGIGNGFHVLTEARLLPGAFVRNKNLDFVCGYVNLLVDNADTRFTTDYKSRQVIQVPIAHSKGCYTVDDEQLAQIRQYNQIVFRYCGADGEISEEYNPNGSRDNVAGIVNKAGNVLGLMPHPERCAETLMYSQDGLGLFSSIKNFLG
jgi:phosphoribosylformylglycinamidine synthase